MTVTHLELKRANGEQRWQVDGLRLAIEQKKLTSRNLPENAAYTHRSNARRTHCAHKGILRCGAMLGTFYFSQFTHEQTLPRMPIKGKILWNQTFFLPDRPSRVTHSTHISPSSPCLALNRRGKDDFKFWYQFYFVMKMENLPTAP